MIVDLILQKNYKKLAPMKNILLDKKGYSLNQFRLLLI